MGKFSKIFKHIESKDLRNKYEQNKAAKIEEEKKKKEFKQYLVSTMETKKYNWREGMSTSDVATISVEKAPGDGTVTAVDAINASSYITTVTGLFTPGDSYDGNTGSQIRNSGSGSGQDGGFALGQQYLSFQGEGYNETGHAIRWAGLSAIDSTEVDTLEINAIVGNDSNGGEDPDAAGEELYVMYKTPEMNQFRFLIVKPDGSFPPGKDGSSTDDVIIPLGASGNSGLNKYSVEIPDFARAKGTEFMLIQLASSGIGFDNYGITEINFQRRTPLTVVVPLDNPEASSFIRSAPPKSTSTPKKRKKAVDDKLQASDDYTASKFGDEFPGREVRVGGEDPFASAKIGDDVEPSPQSKDDVKKAFGATQLKTALGKPTTSQPADPIGKVTDIVKSKDTVNNPKISGIQPVKGNFSNIGNGSQGKMPDDFRTLPAEELANVFSDPTSIEAQEAAVDVVSKEINENKPKTASKLAQTGKAGETFIRYLTGTLPDTIDNEFLGNEYVNSMLKNAKIHDYDEFTLNFGDNILGTTQPPVRVGNEIVIPFNYDFKTNAEELKGKEDELNLLQNTLGRIVSDAFGRYSIDGSPKVFGGIPVIGPALDLISGGIFSKFIETGKAFGGAQHRPGELKLDLLKIAKQNPQFLRELWSKGIINQEEFLQLDKGKPLPKYDPYSEKNYKENLPSWFTFSTRTPDGRIFGFNHSGAYGELKPAKGLAPGEIYTGQPESGYGTRGFDPKTRTGGTSWTMDYDARPAGDIPKASVDPAELELSSILGVEKSKDLAGFKKDASEKKTEVAVSTEARNSVKSSAEISQAILEMSPEEQKAAIEKLYPEKAQEILKAADTNVIKLAIEQGISKIMVNQINNTISTPLLDATTSANGFNEYNKFLGDIAKDSNTPGATYENPIDLSNQIAPGDMNELITTINSGNYQSIVNSIRATNDKDAQKELKKELEAMIKDTINGNFGLNNFMHNAVKVDLNHLLETGKTKLKKQYKFNYGGSAEQLENATWESDPGLFAIKKIADVLGFEYDTLGDPSTVLNTGTPTFNVGGTEVDPLGIVKIIPAIAVTFGPAVVAKLGLTNVKLHGEDSYDAPGMFYEVDVPGKYSVDKNGNPIQSEKPSAAEQIKQTVSNVLNKGKEVVSNLFSFGNEDENAPQREDFPMGRSGAKEYSDAMKLYNAAKSASVNNINVEPQLDLNASDLPVIPPSEEVAALIAAAETGGQAEMDALAKAHAEMMEKQFEAMYKAEAEGASPESLSALSVRQYLARKPLEDALEIDSPVPPLPSEPIEPQREDYPNTRSGAKQYQDAKKAFDAEQASKEISELSNEDAETRVFDIYEQDPDVFTLLYDPLFENDPVYKEYMGIYDEMERNATPEGQELLKQQYEALEFTLHGFATKFADHVLVQPGELNPFGYENTSNQAVTYAGKKEPPAGFVYFWNMSERERFEEVGVDLEKYDEARALLDTYVDDFDRNIVDYIYAQPDYIEAKAEFDRLNAIYISSSNTSKSAWEAYEKFADKYSGREFDLRFEKSEYERVVKRGDELYKAYEDAENKAVEDLNARSEIDLSFNKWIDQIDAAGDMVDGAKDKVSEYWDNYEQELRSKMDIILSKINGDYDYYENMRALDPQMEELFNRVNRQFLELYNNRDDILGTFDDDMNYIPPGFDGAIGTDEIGKPEWDPFENELKPDLGAGDGDDIAWGKKPPNPNEKQGRATHINIINWWQSGGSMGTKPEGWSNQDVENYINRFYLNKSSSAPSDPRTAYAGTGEDDAGTFSFDGPNVARTTLSPSEESILRNQLNHINRTLGPAAGKREQERLLRMYGIFFPLASGNSSNAMVAHFVPRGENLSEVMLVKKTKLQRPKQFFKEPNEFVNMDDIKPEFPDKEPPKLDPNTGMHPEYGKKAKRYGKLDPISANSMPPTGDPEIDAVVNKQKTINKIKKMTKKA